MPCTLNSFFCPHKLLLPRIKMRPLWTSHLSVSTHTNSNSRGALKPFGDPLRPRDSSRRKQVSVWGVDHIWPPTPTHTLTPKLPFSILPGFISHIPLSVTLQGIQFISQMCFSFRWMKRDRVQQPFKTCRHVQTGSLLQVRTPHKSKYFDFW